MLPLEHSAILLTCIKLLSILITNFGVLLERPLQTGFTIDRYRHWIVVNASLSLQYYCCPFYGDGSVSIVAPIVFFFVFIPCFVVQ